MSAGCYFSYYLIRVEMCDVIKQKPLCNQVATRTDPVSALSILRDDLLFTYGSPIFKAVPKKQCKALYRALTKSLTSPESAVGEGSGRSNVEGSVAVPQ